LLNWLKEWNQHVLKESGTQERPVSMFDLKLNLWAVVDIFYMLNRVKAYDCVFIGFCFKYEREVNERKHNSFKQDV
jgi:hypothetical protein